MPSNYAFTLTIWPSLLTVLLMLAVAFYSSRRQNVPGVLPFMIAALFGAIWAAASVMENAAVDLPTKIFWIKFQAACQMPSATAITCFVLEYAWPGRWLTRRNLALLSIAPLLVLGLIITNDLHHFFWRSFSQVGPMVVLHFGPGGWMGIIYSFGLLILNLIVFTWLFLHSPQHRWPVAIMIMGHIGMRTLFSLENIGLIQSVLPLTMVGLAILVSMYAIALFGFRIFAPIPLARQTVIEQLRDGMLVLDPQGRVVSLNPAASKIFAAPLKHVQGKRVEEFLPNLTMPSLPLVDGGAVSRSIEITIGAGAEARCYEIQSSPLDDFRGLPVGCLLLLHDVTEQRRSQAQILEQQRALSKLQEGEQLARELHDGLGQVLGFTGLRMEATRKLIADGKLATADDQLIQLENIVADAHADVREYILNLRTAPTGDRPFFAALQHYLDGFLKNYGIRADLAMGSGVEEGIFAPEAQVQLFRIIQEAFSNARKHAQASCIRLSFEMEDGLVCIRMQDNGKGFDAARAVREGHFGLRIMRERAEQLGGRLEVNSAPEKGTCVTVYVPVGDDTEKGRRGDTVKLGHGDTEIG